MGGLQAQLARPPFIGLWTRLPDFDKGTLLHALHARTIVRVTAMRGTLFLVQVPEPGLTWGYPGAAAFALADQWLETRVSTKPVSPATLVRRYLAAFGPASVADAQTGSRL